MGCVGQRKERLIWKRVDRINKNGNWDINFNKNYDNQTKKTLNEHNIQWHRAEQLQNLHFDL